MPEPTSAYVYVFADNVVVTRWHSGRVTTATYKTLERAIRQGHRRATELSCGMTTDSRRHSDLHPVERAWL